MNHEVLKERTLKIVSKMKKKLDKQDNKDLQQILRNFLKLDSIIFADVLNKQRSFKKKIIDDSSSKISTSKISTSENHMLRSSSFILSSFFKRSSTALSSANQQRRCASEFNFTLKQQFYALKSLQSS